MHPDHETAARLAREYAAVPQHFDTVKHLGSMLPSTLHALLEGYAERDAAERRAEEAEGRLSDPYDPAAVRELVEAAREVCTRDPSARCDRLRRTLEPFEEEAR